MAPHLMSVLRYIVSSLRENWVPGMSIVHENTVWRESRAVARLVLTVTSYMRPLLTVVVVTSVCRLLTTGIRDQTTSRHPLIDNH